MLYGLPDLVTAERLMPTVDVASMIARSFGCTGKSRTSGLLLFEPDAIANDVGRPEKPRIILAHAGVQHESMASRPLLPIPYAASPRPCSHWS